MSIESFYMILFYGYKPAYHFQHHKLKPIIADVYILNPHASFHDIETKLWFDNFRRKSRGKIPLNDVLFPPDSEL